MIPLQIIAGAVVVATNLASIHLLLHKLKLHAIEIADTPYPTLEDVRDSSRIALVC